MATIFNQKRGMARRGAALLALTRAALTGATLAGALLATPALAAPAARAAPEAATAPPPAAPALRLADAQAMAQRAQRAAEAAGTPISIVIVNAEGRVILSWRMDGAAYMTLAVAEQKAITAASIGAPTSVIQKAVAGGDASLLSVPNIAALAGGVPIARGGQVIGGLGVSGSAPAEDERMAGLGAANP